MKTLNSFKEKYSLSEIDSSFDNIKVFDAKNIEYSSYLECLQEIIQILRDDTKTAIILACSHPHCFTNGQGLQKKHGSEQELIDFNPAVNLPFPLYQIKRGGGLTFHHPNQLIIYPFLNLNHFKKSVQKIMLKMLMITKEILETELSLKNLSYKEKLLGLWDIQQNKKIASIGMGLERFITTHGLAINLNEDIEMKEALKQLNPCGLSHSIYSSIELLDQKKQTDEKRDKLLKNFIEKFSSYIAPQN